MILLVKLAEKRSLVHLQENVLPNNTTNIGAKNSEVLKLEISLKCIIGNQWARSRHNTSSRPRKEKTADLDKNHLSASEKTAGTQILSKIGPE